MANPNVGMRNISDLELNERIVYINRVAKVVKGEGEEAKVAMRNIRRDANNAFKDALKAKTISEDEEKRAQDDMQKLTDKFIAEIDKAIAEKERELMAV